MTTVPDYSITFVQGIVSNISPFDIWFPLSILIISVAIVLTKKKNLIIVPLLATAGIFLYKLLIKPFESIGAVAGAIISAGLPIDSVFIHVLGQSVIPIIISVAAIVYMSKKKE